MNRKVVLALIWAFAGVIVPCVLLSYFNPFAAPESLLLAVFVANVIGYYQGGAIQKAIAEPEYVSSWVIKKYFDATHVGQPVLEYFTIDPNGFPDFTPIWDDALQFSRYEDADRIEPWVQKWTPETIWVDEVSE